MGKALPIVVALVVIVVGTYYQGELSERWRRAGSEKLARFTERLKHVPPVLEDWESEDKPLVEREFAVSGCTGYVSRVYRNRETGQEVSVFLVAGTARHVTIHTPDWCYQGAGYEMEGEPNPYVIDCGEKIEVPEFSTTTFIKEGSLSTDHLRIFWSYSDDGRWLGPRWPKPSFAGRPALYKLYLITPIAGGDRSPESSPSVKFTKLFMPTLNEVLFSPAGDEDSAEHRPQQAATVGGG